jgi:hypothetical protein
MRGLRVLFWPIRLILWLPLWLPFWVLSSARVMGAVLLAILFYAPNLFAVSLLAVIVIGGLCLPIEARLRPAPRAKRGRLPKREKPLKPARVRIPVQARRAPRVARTMRRLPRELRAVLVAPVDRQPEAIAHDARMAAE